MLCTELTGHFRESHELAYSIRLIVGNVLETPCRFCFKQTFVRGVVRVVRRTWISRSRIAYQGVDITYDVAFKGDGWLELERSVMPHEEERELVGFEISTNKSNGLIMWHGQTPRELNPDDYISLAVVDGYVEYQYDLGSGPATMRVTAQRVDDGQRHRIIMKRVQSDGNIELDGEHTETGMSDGLQQILNVRGSVYLGGVPDWAMTYGIYREGFSGCIYAMEVQDSGSIDLGLKAIRGKNVSPCTRDGDYVPGSIRGPTRGDI